MKKLIGSALLAATIICPNVQAGELGEIIGEMISSAIVGGTTVGAAAVVYPVPVTLSGVVYAIVTNVGPVFSYQGLESDAVEVLSGYVKLEESPVLSQFKEDLLNNKFDVERSLANEGIDVDLASASDEEIAGLAYMATTHAQ